MEAIALPERPRSLARVASGDLDIAVIGKLAGSKLLFHDHLDKEHRPSSSPAIHTICAPRRCRGVSLEIDLSRYNVLQ